MIPKPALTFLFCQLWDKKAGSLVWYAISRGWMMDHTSPHGSDDAGTDVRGGKNRERRRQKNRFSLLSIKGGVACIGGKCCWCLVWLWSKYILSRPACMSFGDTAKVHAVYKNQLGGWIDWILVLLSVVAHVDLGTMSCIFSFSRTGVCPESVVLQYLRTMHYLPSNAVVFFYSDKAKRHVLQGRNKSWRLGDQTSNASPKCLRL